MDQMFYESTMATQGPQQFQNQSVSIISNRSHDVIKWSDTIANIARATERNLSSIFIFIINKGLDAYENSRDQSAFMNQTNMSHFQQPPQQQQRPPMPKFKIKKPSKLDTSPSQYNNYFQPPKSTQNFHQTANQSYIFSFGGNSPSMRARDPSPPMHMGTRSMTPTSKNTLFQKLDFYGRKMKHSEIEHQRMNSMSSEIQGNVSQQQLHDTIELELRSQLDIAKNDLTQVHKTLESKIKSEINKYPQFANEESEVASKVHDLYSKFEIFENEVVRRTKDLLKGYNLLKSDQQNLQKRYGDFISSKELEMGVSMVKSELEELIVKNREDTAILKSQFKSMKFEIENDILKRLKHQQNEHDSKLEDFYKFKTDVYNYLDRKYEGLTNTYGMKLKGIGEFIDAAEDKIRVLWDQKDSNDFIMEDFKQRFNQKIKLIEETASGASNKTIMLDAKQKDIQTYIMRLKTAVTEMQKERGLAARVEILEKKISDTELSNQINFQIDLQVSDRIRELQVDNDRLINDVKQQMDDLRHTLSSTDKNLAFMNANLETKFTTLKDKHSNLLTKNEEQHQKLEEDYNAKLKASMDTLAIIKQELESKQQEQEQAFLSSFTEIKSIVLSKMQEFDQKSVTTDERMVYLEQQVIDVGQKYEHFQELFTNLIQEMQTTTENDEEQNSLSRQDEIMIEGQDEMDDVKLQESDLKEESKIEESKIIIEGDLLMKRKSRNNSSKDLEDNVTKSITSVQNEHKKLFLSPPSRNTNNTPKLTSSLPVFMVSHIQSQKNKIFLENSPERKSHDNMLISPKHKKSGSFIYKSGQSFNQFNDEANVIEKIDSQQIMSSQKFNEVLIAKQEQLIKAYSQKYLENIQRSNNSLSDYNVIEVELETEYDGQVMTEEQQSEDFIKDEELDSSSYTYELIDQSIHSSSMRMVNDTKPEPLKQFPQGMVKSSNLQQKSHRSNGDEEFNDLYEYSDDEDEAIFPFDHGSPTEVITSPSHQHISVIEQSQHNTTNKKTNPLEMLLMQSSQISRQMAVKPKDQTAIQISDERIEDPQLCKMSSESILPLTKKFNMFEDSELKVMTEQEQREMQKQTDILTFEICAEFVAMELAQMFRNSINRSK